MEGYERTSFESPFPLDTSTKPLIARRPKKRKVSSRIRFAPPPAPPSQAIELQDLGAKSQPNSPKKSSQSDSPQKQPLLAQISEPG